MKKTAILIFKSLKYILDYYKVNDLGLRIYDLKNLPEDKVYVDIRFGKINGVRCSEITVFPSDISIYLDFKTKDRYVRLLDNLACLQEYLTLRSFAHGKRK